MQYCFVQENKVIGKPQQLPRNTKTVSGLHLASMDSLRKKGWYPVKRITPEYNSDIQRLGLETYEIKEDCVEVSRIIHDMSEEMIALTAQRKLDAIEKDEIYTAIQYQRDRESEYPTTKDLIVALWEMIIEDRPEFSVELQKKRMLVKEKYPKPNIVT